jgi:hypothetical protein
MTIEVRGGVLRNGWVRRVRRWRSVGTSSSSPTCGSGGVQEGGMRMVSGRVVPPPLTGGHEAPPPTGG